MSTIGASQADTHRETEKCRDGRMNRAEKGFARCINARFSSPHRWRGSEILDRACDLRAASPPPTK